MKTFFNLLFAGLLALVSTAVNAETESDLIGILQSTASVPDKCAACQKLRVIGTVKAIPALAALLGQERTSQAARYALEAMPVPEAGEALRAALGTTSGLIKAGLIDSLGWRGDVASVALLKPLLTDSDPAIASPAATALGRIGSPEGVAALITARDTSGPAVQPAVLEALLRAADKLVGQDNPRAAAIYRGLCDQKFSREIRAAAWRGLVLADPEPRAEMIKTALSGADRALQMAALKMIRELSDVKVLEACLSQWESLPPESQLAVLDAQLKRGAEALTTVRAASQNRNLALRIAAWQAWAGLNDLESIPVLAKAAATSDPTEREAARETLIRLHGPGMREAFLAQINKVDAASKAELLRALGERGDKGATGVLLQNASTDPEPVRLAALESLRILAVPDTLTALLELASKSNSDAVQGPLVKALFAVCQASPDKEQASRRVIDAMNRFAPAARRQTLPLLAELGTPAALDAALAATKDQDREVVKEAVRVLAQWPNAAPAARLLELARASDDPTLHALALRGCIEVVGQEPDLNKRLDLLQLAMAAARRIDEKKQALGQIGQIPTIRALEAITPSLSDPNLANEAGLAAVAVAEKIAAANPQLASETAAKVLAQSQNPDTIKRAWALRGKAVKPGPFLRDWLVCGSYRQANVTGAIALFDLEFGPEKPGQPVQWQAAPRADQIDLAGLFPGQDNCVAYLKTQILAPEDTPALLLLGSDDGVKAWLNGAVVHSHNIDRGLVIDQDTANIKLRKGTNDLMLKVTQGGGGWAVCARLVGMDGQSLPGLRTVPVAGTAVSPQPAAVPQPRTEVVPKPAALPPRDAFRTLQLSDQFYTEGAYYGDFNRDGQLDVVAGPFWFAGPDFQKRHEYRTAKSFDPKDYSDNFLTFTGDFNHDGWIDILCVPFPGKDAYWYENPAGKDTLWKPRLACTQVGNESPVWGDVTGDGQPELIYCINGYLGYASPDPTKPDAPWKFQAISTKDNRYQQFTHGVGFGDINGDQRVDLIEAAGWWEQPDKPQPDQPWIFHPFQFADWPAQMLVYDVDGDGLADVITAWNCHHYGLVWWQQIKTVDGQPGWKKHEILSPAPDVTTADFRVSQMHAFDLVDMNGDGLKDIVTGKRFWAHGPTGDKEPDAPAIVFWLELRRGAQGAVTFAPHLIDDNSGVGTQVAAVDLNGDGRPDVIVGNKKGIFVHLSRK